MHRVFKYYNRIEHPVCLLETYVYLFTKSRAYIYNKIFHDHYQMTMLTELIVRITIIR
jgi:hypothetical protein